MIKKYFAYFLFFGLIVLVATLGSKYYGLYASEKIFEQPIYFTKGAPGIKMLVGVGNSTERGDGWAYPESWGTWTEGSKSLIVIPVRNSEYKSAKLEVQPFIGPKIKEQYFDVIVNGVKSYPYKLSDPRPQFIDLPLQVDGNIIFIEFVLHSPSSPKDNGLGLDDRRLALGLISLNLIK